MKYKVGQTLISRTSGNRFAIIGIHEVRQNANQYATVYELSSSSGAISRWSEMYMHKFRIDGEEE